ncbi:hypothetical protein BGZ83_007606 [Gryganskiella cystojenkinii]|nr:hypothetical protein BGZ83_007606 [Gryganskiella cystojenkinii]
MSAKSFIPTTATATSRISEIPVLISGAGPTGLFAALLLTKMHIPCRIIERGVEFSPLAKCLWIHARTLEILQMADAEVFQQFLDEGDFARRHRYYYGGKLRGELEFAPKTESQFAKPLHIPQDRTVRILATALEKLGVKIEWGWELIDTQVTESSEIGVASPSTLSSLSLTSTSWVETKIRRAIHGTNERMSECPVLGTVEMDPEEEQKQYEYETIKSQFLIAADGGRSTVRHKINMAFPGRTRNVGVMIFDGEVESDNLSMNYFNWIRGNAGRTVAVIPLGGNRIQIGAENGYLTQEQIIAQKSQTPTLEEFQQYLDSALEPLQIKVKSVNWLTYYHVNERRAQEFSYKGRIFLAGDAAHIQSPSAGQGLNQGMHDVHNLAWKIALVVQGNAPLSLLETYSQERAPVADAIIKLTSDSFDADFHLDARWIIRRFLVQSTLSGPGAIGRRAPDAALVPVQGHSRNHSHKVSRTIVLSEHDNSVIIGTEAKTEVTTRLYELMTHTGSFQVLVFTGDLWKRQPETAQQQLSEAINRHLSSWRSNWTRSIKEVDAEEDGKNVRPLFMVHTLTIATAVLTVGKEVDQNVLADKDVGEGKIYLDLDGLLHRRYDVNSVVKKGPECGGAIVVVRPDSYIAYRTQGVGERAWNDVSEYFESILVHSN